MLGEPPLDRNGAAQWQDLRRHLDQQNGRHIYIYHIFAEGFLLYASAVRRVKVLGPSSAMSGSKVPDEIVSFIPRLVNLRKLEVFYFHSFGHPLALNGILTGLPNATFLRSLVLKGVRLKASDQQHLQGCLLQLLALGFWRYRTSTLL
jgi:hypothetical protein